MKTLNTLTFVILALLVSSCAGYKQISPEVMNTYRIEYSELMEAQLRIRGDIKVVSYDTLVEKEFVDGELRTSMQIVEHELEILDGTPCVAIKPKPEPGKTPDFSGKMIYVSLGDERFLTFGIANYYDPHPYRIIGDNWRTHRNSPMHGTIVFGGRKYRGALQHVRLEIKHGKLPKPKGSKETLEGVKLKDW